MSRQEILDDPASAFPHLHQFLGGYFHQDWPLDDRGWEMVVDDFIAESPQPDAAGSITELSSLLSNGFSDHELTVVLEGLGCSVDPSAFHLPAEDWLRAVLRRLAG
jgi:hypothetical protein